MLQRLIRFPKFAEFTEFNEGSAPSRKKLHSNEGKYKFHRYPRDKITAKCCKSRLSCDQLCGLINHL